jgi:tetratricopeptide (TPR) repeat protein
MGTPALSSAFQQLYCDATVFDSFSAWHPISLKRALPFQPQDPVVDDQSLLDAERAHLVNQNDNNRRAVIDAYAANGLMSPEDAANVKSVIDYFGSNFFELMGMVYANAGIFICALRWYRECIAVLETQKPDPGLDHESVYASVGYCLYSLGMFEEAIAWTKSCIGSQATTDIVGRTLVDYEAQQAGGHLRATERATNRTRYTIAVPDSENMPEIADRLKVALDAFAPFQEVYIDRVNPETPLPEIGEGYPFRLERDNSPYLRHKMNLLFATAAQADALAAKGHTAEALRLLSEAVLLEPNADFIQERIKGLS